MLEWGQLHPTTLPTIPYKTRQDIVAQALEEIQWDRTYKQGKISGWQLNERLYYKRRDREFIDALGKAYAATQDSRANVDLGRMQEFVHTLLSKIDNPLIFKFLKRKTSQLMRVARLNALRVMDADDDDWDIKDIAGKKQSVMYGRAVYSYAADSVDGYQPHLENVDVYDFLIDPAGGGLDIERALNMGRYGVVKMRADIEQGVKDGTYLRTEAKFLLDGDGNSTESTQEKTNQQPRTADTQVWKTQKNIGNEDKFIFWEWYTTYGGKRYYLLLSESGGTAIRVEELTTIFASGLWPFWTWAAFIDLTEFWSPSNCDYVVDIFLAQGVSINQLLDNAEQRNKPQRAINTGAVKNLAQLKYKRGGNYIEVTGDRPIAEVFQIVEVPTLDTPITVFNTLEGIQEKASGVTAGAKGDADADGKATIYEGNQAAAADRFGLLNKSYSFGYKRFARLWQAGVREHLTRKVAIDMLGPDGIELEDVKASDIFRKGDTFKVTVEASDAETALSELEKRTKIQFLTAQSANPIQIQNPKKAYEVAAQIAGFDEDTIRQLLDTSDFGDADLMAEADRDIEQIIDGKPTKPNRAATTAYKQRFVDFMADNEDDLTATQQAALMAYVDQLDPIIMKNLARKLAEQALKSQAAATVAPQGPGVPPAASPAPGMTGAPIPGMPGPAGMMAPAPGASPTATISQIAP